MSSGLYIILSLRTIVQTGVLTKTFQTDCTEGFAHTNLEGTCLGKVHLDCVNSMVQQSRPRLTPSCAAVRPARAVGPQVFLQLSFEQLKKAAAHFGSNSSGVTNHPSDASISEFGLVVSIWP